jgi:ABC-type uncharacterized transport system involved in gliding motility auxiliary subunit
MSARRFALFAALAMFLMFVAGNVIANSWLKSWRLDLTENHLYSLSPGTQRTLDQLSEPIELKFYYSRDAATRVPQVQAYGARVREMLQTFAARSHGRVRFVELNVKPFSDEEDAASQAGIEPVTVVQGADPLYFGLTGANGIDDHRAIPFFDPQREAFLEYEVTRLIYELEHPDRTKVALITSLPMDPATAANPSMGASQQSTFAIEMGRLMDVTKLAPDFTEIPDADVLVIVHPGPLTAAQMFAVDQFILRKGRAFIALDPASLASLQQQGGMDPFNPPAVIPPASNLDPLLSRWGVTMTRDVVLDLDGALAVNATAPTGQQTQAPQPLFFSVPAAQLDHDDLMTAWLTRSINFGLAGGLSWREGLDAHALAKTTGRTMRMPAAQALSVPSPFEIMNQWPQTGGRIETVAMRLSGNLETAFPQGAPEGAPPPAQGQRVLARSATPAQIVIVADSDFLDDNFYMDRQSGSSAADNASFVLNAIDVLSGSDALVSLRSRAPSARRMELVENMERDAQRSIEHQREQLQRDLEETEARLQTLQNRGRGSGFFSGNLGAELTPEENHEIEAFRAHVTQVRGELRNVERNLRGNINNLETLVVFINVWLAPLLVAVAGLILFWRRQRRVRGVRR